MEGSPVWVLLLNNFCFVLQVIHCTLPVIYYIFALLCRLGLIEFGLTLLRLAS